MSLHLILTRHAKSDWGDPTQDDFDRPLNPRGRKSAAAIGLWLAGRGHVPQQAIVSGARRTVDTWSLVSEAFGERPEMRSDPVLYHAGSETYLKVLQSQSAPVVMLVGHNPGIAEFAERFAKDTPDHPRFRDYPTCATTVFAFNGPDWTTATWGSAQIADFVVPRELL